MKVRIHYTTGDGLATCRMPLVLTTEDAAQVTCRLCLGVMAKVAARAVLERDRRGDERPAVLDGPGRSEVGALGAFALARSIAGEPVSTGPRWGGIASALEALVRAQAERRSIASASSPDRFGQRGGGGTNSTPTTPRETQDDLMDVEIARDAASQAMRIGERALTGREVLRIAELRIVGRVVVKRIPGRRGTYCELAAVSGQEVADASGLTRHQVGIVVRRFRAVMGPALAAKGLIPRYAAEREQRQEQGENEETSMAAVAGYDLEGWKAIAPVTGASENWCREQARREVDPLPVKYYRGRVVAKRVEVAAWVARQVRDAPAA